MPRFPIAEPEIAALAALVVEGLEHATEDFPTPPVPATELRAQLDAYAQTRAATVVAETAFREQHAEKDEALEDLVDSTKANLKYAEFAVKDRPGKLSQLGWAPRRSGTPLEEPGEVRNIKLVGEGDSWVVLRWESRRKAASPRSTRSTGWQGISGTQWRPRRAPNS
jgi:hypothetical protein